MVFGIMRKIIFFLKQVLKMLLQNTILPCVYAFWKVYFGNKEPELIVFADAHHDCIPFSMQRIRDELIDRGYAVTDFFYDFSSISQFRSAWLSIRFMRLYANAKCVFICDNFLPVSSCRKGKGTKVVQLWHACGLIKKMGYDATDDIPAYYVGNVYRNYDLVTVSSPNCVDTIAGAMGLEKGVVRALGVSRTDCYFDDAWIESCKEEFFEKYPEARTKKIILWAPTFRGNAADPYCVGMEEISQLEDEYFVIRKVHPHLDKKYPFSNCSIPAERLLPVIDLLITDFSTVLTEFLFFNKPCVLFAPDLEEYLVKRGLYVEYDSLSPYIAKDAFRLKQVVKTALNDKKLAWIGNCRDFHVSACDGMSTERILKTVGLNGQVEA